MGKRSFWQSLRRKKWLASTGMLAAGALAVYGVWQIPSLNQYHMETLEAPATDGEENENTDPEDTNMQNQENNGFDLPRDTEGAEKKEDNQNENQNDAQGTKQEKTVQETADNAGNSGNLAKQSKKEKKSDKKTEEENDSVEVLSNPQSVLEAGNFDESAGLLWPIEGDIILNYDTDGVVYFQTLAQYRANPAIMIAGETGSKVKASAEGIVEEITENEETGVTVRTSVGNSYEIIYGQLKNLKVSEGDTVKEGSVIGTLAEPTDYFTVEGPNLYYQILQDGTPVNPLLLLK